ncbi:MAG: putative LPS assembly protein LptD [Bacteroidota bacterium]|nr:putative LPS assembly protein LptD [Bacteroidota bacterium]
MIKNLLTNILFLVAISSFGQLIQQSDTIPDPSLMILSDSTIITPFKTASDSIVKPVLEATITYSAIDSTIADFENQKVFMYKGGVVNYQSIELKADYIMLDLVNKEVYAEGLPDSTGTKVGNPVFKDGNEEFESKTLRYNFETQKGYITEVKTSQGDGFVHSELTKKISKDEFILRKGKYTTCDAEHPHFYLRMTRAKVISNEKIITGPAYMVLEDFPIYFPMLPFGYFPNSTTYTSGILIPTYGEEQGRGFFLREGGYYWAANEFFDLSVRGDIYSKGSWAGKLHTNYKVRYKYNGSLDFSYNLNKYSEEPLPDARTTKGFSLTWSHSQDSKANPNRTFSANVNLSTSSFDKENSLTVRSYLQTQKSSSISYSKRFENTPFNMSMNLRHSQNSRDTTISLSLPEMTMNMSKVNPFKVKSRIGPVKWYEKISFSYSGSLKNSITSKEKEIFQKSLVRDWQNGIRHSIPISLPSFNLMKYINLSPSFNYSERWYTNYINKTYDPTYNNPIPGGLEHVLVDTIYAFRRNYEYSYSLSSSTNIYGMYIMRNPNSKVKAIRHKITPSVSFSYTPDFGQKKFRFWDSYIDASGRPQYYSHFEKGVFGYTGRGESGAMSFSLSQNLEAKVLEVNDTTKTDDNKPVFKKVKIIDNLGMNASYNMIADSMKLTPISISARTTIKGVSVNMGANLNPYMIDAEGKIYDEYVWNHLKGINKLGRLTNANLSFGMNFESKKGKKEAEENKELIDEDKALPGSYSQYVDFNIPWSFRFDYSFYYTNSFNPKDENAKKIMQSLNFGGRLNLTEKWNMDMNTNFDIQAMKFSFTTVNVSRTLHCWSMSFSFVPFGERKSYSFNLSASSAMLRDLKISKQSSWRDN